MVQLLPADDPFTDGYTPRHTSWEPYFHLFPWNSDAVYASGGTGFGLNFNEWNSQCRLYDGWFGQATPPATGALANPAAMVRRGTSPALQTLFWPGAFVWRAKSIADCSVEMSWQLQSDNLGAASSGVSLMVGVGARLSGGTVFTQGFESLNVHLATSGYWFFKCTKLSSPWGFKHMLVSVSGGVVTRLMEDPVGAAAFNSFASGSLTSPQRLRMTVEAEGPDVRIKCYSRLESDVAETLVLNFLDNTGTKITTAGCSGILLTNERKPTGSFICATCANWWQLASPDNTTTIYVRDEWERLNPQGTYFEDGTFAWRTGHSLMSGWYGDNFSAAGVWPQAESQVLSSDGPDSGIDRLVFFTNTGLGAVHVNDNVDGIFLSQRIADDSSSQDRQISGRYSSAGSGVQARAFGVALRCSAPAPSALPNCYYCVHEVDDVALSAAIRLYRSSPNGVEVLAEKTGVAYVLDADVVIRMTIADVAGASRIRVRLNSVLVVLVAPASPVTGITIAGDGTVDDASSFKIASGSGEGFYARKRWSSGTLRPLYLDSWVQGPGETYTPPPPPPPPPPPVDLTPIPVSTEIDGAFGLLDLGRGGQWEIELEVSDPGVVQKYETDHAQSFAIQSRVRRSWEITNNVVGTSADAALIVFFDDHDGVEIPFQWVTDEGDTAYVVFTTPDLVQRIRDAGVYGYKFGLQERFAP